MDPKGELEATLGHLRALDKKLDEYERTHDKALLAYVQEQVKQMGPQLKAMIQNPAFKSPENSENFLELRDAMKNVIKRSKALSEQASASRNSGLQPGNGSGIIGMTRRRGSDADKNPIRVGDPPISTSFNTSNLTNRNSLSDRRKSGATSDPSGDRYTPGMVVDLHEGSGDLIDMRTKPSPIAAWMKKQGEDLFKAWKRRWFLQKMWRIEYFKSDKVTSPSDVLGYIDIASLRKINIVRDPKFAFHLETEFRLYILQAESQADLERIVFGLVQWRSHYLYENASDKKAFSESVRPLASAADATISPRPSSSQSTDKDKEGDSIRSELVQMFSKAKVERQPSPNPAVLASKGNGPESELSLAIRTSRRDEQMSPVRNLGGADFSANYDRKISKPSTAEGSLPRQLSLSSLDRVFPSPSSPYRPEDTSDAKNPFGGGGEKLSTSSNPFGEKVTSNPFGDRVSATASNPFVEKLPASAASNPFGDKPTVGNPYGERASTPSHSANPFGEKSSSPNSNPFGEKISTSANPFGEKTSVKSNPFGEKISTSSNPFGDVPSASANPFGSDKASVPPLTSKQSTDRPVTPSYTQPSKPAGDRPVTPSHTQKPSDKTPAPLLSSYSSPSAAVPATSASANQFGERAPSGKLVMGEKGSGLSDEAKTWKAEHDKVLRELTQLKDRYTHLEKEAHEAKKQVATLSETQRLQRESKVELEAALEAQNEERGKRRKAEEDAAAMATRFDIERRNWNEERRRAEEDAAATRREKASLIAEQRSLEEQIVKLKVALEKGDKKAADSKGHDASDSASSSTSSPSRNPFGSSFPDSSSAPAFAHSHADVEEIKQLSSELKDAKEKLDEEKRKRKDAETSRDEMKKQVEIEIGKREKEEARRKEEFLALKSEMERDRRKMQEVKEELDQERRARQLEEKKRAVRTSAAVQDRVSRADQGGHWEESQDRGGASHDFAELERMLLEANLSPAQYDAVVQRMTKYLAKYCPSADDISDLEEQISSLIEQLSIAKGKAEESKKESMRLMSEYGTRDKYISSLRAQLEESQHKNRGDGAKQVSELGKQVEKWRETAEAHEMQSTVLGKQIEIISAEHAIELKAKDTTIAALRKDLRVIRKNLRSLVESQMLQCGATQADLNLLEEAKRELFFTLAIFTKQNLAESGVSCNVNLSDLFEEAKDMDFHQWRHWIQSRLNAEAGIVPRTYSSTISGKGMDTLAPESGKGKPAGKPSGNGGSNLGGAPSRAVSESSSGFTSAPAPAASNRSKGKGKSKARTVDIK